MHRAGHVTLYDILFSIVFGNLLIGEALYLFEKAATEVDTTMVHPFCKKPCPFEELMFIDAIYKDEATLLKRIGQYGYKMHRRIDVSKVDCFMYLPKNFLTTPEEFSEFNFKPLPRSRHQRVTVGICIGGTTLWNGWDEKSVLGIEGILKLDRTRDRADRAASSILQALDEFYETVREYGIKLHVHISGYSLGGLYAQVATIRFQDWAFLCNSIVTCRTYEAPGIPEPYHREARLQSNGDARYWSGRIVNYKSMPNPLNTVFRDLGRVYHLKNHSYMQCDANWVFKCIAGTTKRAVTYISIFNQIMNSTTTTSKDENEDSDREESSTEILVASVIAAELGLELREVVRHHDVEVMIGCFNPENGELLKGSCVEMNKWPVQEGLLKLVGKYTIDKFVKEFIPMDPDNAGLHTLFAFGGKQGYLDRKLANIPGYEPVKN